MESTTAVMNGTKEPGFIPPFFLDAPVNWPVVLVLYGQAWPLHVYTSALCYLVLAVWGLVHLIRVTFRAKLPSKPYYFTLNLSVFICCSFRAFFFLVDPYGSRGILTLWQIVLTIAPLLPSITTGFFLLFATLMRLTKVRVVSTRIFSPRVTAFITLFNYSFGLTADMVGVLVQQINILMLICEAYFAAWGVLASSGYFYVFARLYNRVVMNRRNLNKLSTVEASSQSGHGEKSQQEPQSGQLDTKMPVAAKLTLVCGIAFFFVGLLHIWRIIVAVIATSKGKPYADPWEFFVYRSLLRIAEIVLCSTVLYVGCLPFYGPSKK